MTKAERHRDTERWRQRTKLMTVSNLNISKFLYFPQSPKLLSNNLCWDMGISYYCIRSYNIVSAICCGLDVSSPQNPMSSKLGYQVGKISRSSRVCRWTKEVSFRSWHGGRIISFFPSLLLYSHEVWRFVYFLHVPIKK